MECLLGCEQTKKRKFYMDETRTASCILQSRLSKDSRPDLKNDQKKLIQETWAIVKEDISRVGVITFMK